MDKSLFFLFLSFLLVWLILDNFYGNRIIGNFVDNLLGLEAPSGKTAVEKAAENHVKRASNSKYEAGGVK